MTKRKCTKTIYEINNLGESYFVSQLKTILRSHDCDIETLKKQITDGVVVKDFTVDGILPDENGDFKTGYGERIKELEEKTVEVKVDNASMFLNEEGELTTDINTDTTNKTERLLEDNYNKMLSANKGSDGFNSNETLSFSGYNYSLNSQIENSYVTKNEILSPGYYSNLISSSTGQKDFNIQTTISSDSYEKNISFKNESIFHLSIGIDRKSFSVGKENVAFSVDNIKADINGNISTDYENRITELEKRPTIVGDGKSIRVGADGVVELGYKTGTGIGAPELIKGVYTFEHPTTGTNKLHLNPATGVSIQSYEDRISYTGDFSSKSFIFNVDGKTSKYSFEDITIGNNKIKFPKADESILPTKWLDNYIPLIVDGKVANEFGVLETGYEDRIVALENTPSGINPENIGFGLSYTDDKIQLGEESKDALGNIKHLVKLEDKDTVSIGEIVNENKIGTGGISVTKYYGTKVLLESNGYQEGNFSQLDMNGGNFRLVGHQTNNSGVIRTAGIYFQNGLFYISNSDGAGTQNQIAPLADFSAYTVGLNVGDKDYKGNIATVPYIEDYVSKNGGVKPSEIGFGLSYSDGKVQLGVKKEKQNKIYNEIFKLGSFTSLGNYVDISNNTREGTYILNGDLINEMHSKFSGEHTNIKQTPKNVNIESVSGGLTNLFSLSSGFTTSRVYNSEKGIASQFNISEYSVYFSRTEGGRTINLNTTENNDGWNLSLFENDVDYTGIAITKPYLEHYVSTLMEGSVASAKYVDTKVEELTAIIADLQKQIEELKK